MSGKKALVPPLGLLTVAALFPSDWRPRLVDLNVRPLTEADWDGVDIVMVTGMLVQRESLLSLVREAKARGKLTVAGGAYPTTMPDEVLAAGCDFLVKGEGENTIPDLIAAIRTGARSGVFSREKKPSLDDSPIPRFDLANLEDYESLSIQTSRGCPFSCEFCDIVSLFGRAQRHKKPERVLDELEAIRRLGFQGPIFVADDNFIGNRPRAVTMLHQLIDWQARRGEPFSFITQASVNLGQDLELLDLMTAANFSFVFVGIESPDENVLTSARKHQNVKNPLLESVRAINANGLSVIGSFILGMDEETAGAGERMRAFAEAADIPLVMVNVLRALPQTALWDRLQAEGRLQDGIAESGWDALTNFAPKRPVSEIFAEQVAALDALHAPAAYLGRAFRAALGMRPTRASRPGAAPRAKPDPALAVPRKSRDRELASCLHLLWRQGVVSPARGQFWRQLLAVARQNPSRLRRYLVLCGMGENLFAFVRHVDRQALGQPGSRIAPSGGTRPGGKARPVEAVGG